MNYLPATSLVAGSLCGLWLWASRRHVRETTAVPAVNWAVLTVLLVGSVELLALWQGEAVARLPALRHMVAVATFCPLISLLGAKRPQDKPWQLIVLSLWVVLALPALETLVFRPDMRPDLHTSRKLFLALLVFIGFFNGLFTRHALAVLLATCGQALLLAEYLPLVAAYAGEGTAAARVAAAQVLLLLSSGLWALRQGTPQRELPLDRLWLDFRDLYGTVWGLRIADRINSAAQMYDWDVALHWRGFCDREGKLWTVNPDTDAALQKMMRTLLRRFVSPEWINARLGNVPNEAADEK